MLKHFIPAQHLTGTTTPAPFFSEKEVIPMPFCVLASHTALPNLVQPGHPYLSNPEQDMVAKSSSKK